MNELKYVKWTVFNKFVSRNNLIIKFAKLLILFNVQVAFALMRGILAQLNTFFGIQQADEVYNEPV